MLVVVPVEDVLPVPEVEDWLVDEVLLSDVVVGPVTTTLPPAATAVALELLMV